MKSCGSVGMKTVIECPTKRTTESRTEQIASIQKLNIKMEIYSLHPCPQARYIKFNSTILPNLYHPYH